MNWTKDNTIFLQAGTFLSNEYKKNGFQIYKTYLGEDFIFRVIREFFFRIPFLPKTIWYNRKFLSIDAKFIVLRDPLITRDYIEWLHNCFPNAKIIFRYANLIGKARHLYPNEIPSYVSTWTYDKNDSDKYGINLYKAGEYFFTLKKPLKIPKYDIFYIGRDKGRGDSLYSFEKNLKQAGLKSKFIITKDGRLSKNKAYYKNEIPYSQVIDFLSESKAVLNVALPDQKGITMRDLEAAFMGIKLITTNKYIIDTDLYIKDNVFILDLDHVDTNEIIKFINMPIKPWARSVLENYTPGKLLDEITQ